MKSCRQKEMTKVVMAPVEVPNMSPMRHAVAERFQNTFLQPTKKLHVLRSIFNEGTAAEAKIRLAIATGRLNQSITVRQLPRLASNPVIGAPTLNARNPAATIHPTALPLIARG